MKYATSKPADCTSEEYWSDKSQDTEWLRGGFLARGKELDDLERRVSKLCAAYTAHEEAIREALFYKAFYRAGFGITLGVLIVRLFT